MMPLPITLTNPIISKIQIFVPSNLRAAACKDRELHFSDHLVEFLIFSLKIPLE